MKIGDIHQYFLDSRGVSTDTRDNLENKLFFALKGENFDGNQFAQKAINAGADYAVVDDKTLPDSAQFIVVEDVLITLQDLATFHRQFLKTPIISITGSNGKTTTKELISAVLSTSYEVVYTQGNLNNHIGVPLTLLSLKESTEIGVVEMGANHQGEIAKLSQIAQPDYGYITNFGKAHLEGFGGVEGVIKGKSELYDYLRSHDKQIFINADDSLEVKQSKGGNIISYSKNKGEDCQVIFKELDPYVCMEYKDLEIRSQLLGDYNAKNIAAAICIGQYFKVPSLKMKEAIENYKPDNNRSQIIEKNTNKIILDAYNANPTSMCLAIQNFEKFPAPKRVAVLGDMFEIGKTALKEHQNIVDLLESSTIDQAFVCGEMFAQTKTQRVKAFKSFDELKDKIAQYTFNNTTFLIKGSRGMAMERLMDIL